MIEMDTPIVLHADQEHERLRTAVMFLLLFLLIIIFIASRALFSSTQLGQDIANYSFVLSCVTSLMLALTIGWAAENYLKSIWRSGSTITVTPHEIITENRGEPEVRLNRNAGATPLSWYFKLENVSRNGRERRLPRNSICLATELAQGDGRVVVYSYMSTKEAAAWTESFTEINPRSLPNEKKSRFSAAKARTIPVELLRGKNGRYWLAERHRWQTGMELTNKDFETFMKESGE